MSDVTNTNQDQEQPKKYSVQQMMEDRNKVLAMTSESRKAMAVAFNAMPSDDSKELLAQAMIKVQEISNSSGVQSEQDGVFTRLLKGKLPKLFKKVDEAKIRAEVDTKSIKDIGDELLGKIDVQIESAKSAILAVAELSKGFEQSIPVLEQLCEQLELAVEDEVYDAYEQQQLKLLLIETKADKNRIVKLRDDCLDQMNSGSTVVASMIHRRPQIETQFNDEFMILESLERISGLQESGDAIDVLLDGMATSSTDKAFDIKERLIKRQVEGEGVKRLAAFTDKFEKRSQELQKTAKLIPKAIEQNLDELTRQEGVLKQRGETIKLTSRVDATALLLGQSNKE